MPRQPGVPFLWRRSFEWVGGGVSLSPLSLRPCDERRHLSHARLLPSRFPRQGQSLKNERTRVGGVCVWCRPYAASGVSKNASRPRSPPASHARAGPAAGENKRVLPGPVLQELKNEWGAFTGSDTWLPTNDCATISGVFCNQEGTVLKLYLPNRGLTGSIPTSIVTLRIGRINLSDNRLTGPLPPSLFDEDNNVEL
ncbi:unnamed protein product [Closterium sp. NIES-64]|nr:unnamed protein product [Closterium sp. NIES-64]